MVGEKKFTKSFFIHSFKEKIVHKIQCNKVYTTVLGDEKTKRENLNGEKSK